MKAIPCGSRTLISASAATMASWENTPPELAADISQNGMVLAGGGALLRGLDRVLSEKTEIPVRLAPDPMSAVINGAGIVLDHPKEYRNLPVPLRSIL